MLIGRCRNAYEKKRISKFEVSIYILWVFLPDGAVVGTLNSPDGAGDLAPREKQKETIV